MPNAAGLLTAFETVDLAEARSKVGSVFKPHVLSVDGPRLSMRMQHMPLGAVSLNQLTYGASVLIDPSPHRDFFMVQMPLAGQADIVCDKQHVVSDTRVASVLSPSETVRMRWSGDCTQLVVRIDRAALESAARAHSGRPMSAGVTFALAMEWRAKMAWCHLLNYLGNLIEEAPAMLGHPLTVSHLEQSVIETLLASHPYSDGRSAALHRPLAPRHVRRVEEYIDAHAAEVITPAQMAEIAGVSLRSLYMGFQEHRGTTPMSYLRTVRLERVREALQDNPGVLSVTDAALAWGFAHLGRFSSSYSQRFGERPSETLARRNERAPDAPR